MALLEKLATDFDWPDKSIHQEIRQGFKLIGSQEPSGVFTADTKPRSLTEEELDKQLKFLKPAFWGKVQASPKMDYEEELWEATMQEMKQKHWLDGPYSKCELDVLFEDNWLPVRRFALWQRSKWRAIDDFSECGVNSTFSYLEKVDLKALDEIVWMACSFVRYCVFENRFDFTLASGEKLCGSVNPEWKQMPESAIQLVAKKNCALEICVQTISHMSRTPQVFNSNPREAEQRDGDGVRLKNTSIWKCGICFTFQQDLNTPTYVGIATGRSVDKLL